MERRKGLRILSVLALTGCVALMSPSALSRPMDPASEALFPDRTFIMTGTGDAVDVAETNACRAAVEAAIGTLLDPDVIEENGSALDTIRSRPMDFIVSYEKLESRQKNDGGPWEVKVRAVISESRLKAEFATKKISRRAIDGKALKKLLDRDLKNKTQLSEQFRQTFPEPGLEKGLYAANLLTISGDLLTDPELQPFEEVFELIDRDEEHVNLGFKVSVEVDQKAWQRWATEARKALSDVATERGKCRVGTYGKDIRTDATWLPDLPPMTDWFAFCGERTAEAIKGRTLPEYAFNNLMKSTDLSELGLPFEPDQLLIMIPETQALDMDWEWYQIPRDPLILDMARALMTPPPSLELMLHDGEDKPLAVTVISGAGIGGFHCAAAEMLEGDLITANSSARDHHYETQDGEKWLSGCTYRYGSNWSLNGLVSRTLDIGRGRAVCLLPGFVSKGIAVRGYELPVVVRLPLSQAEMVTGVRAELVPHRGSDPFKGARTLQSKAVYDGDDRVIIKAPYKVN